MNIEQLQYIVEVAKYSSLTISFTESSCDTIHYQPVHYQLREGIRT